MPRLKMRNAEKNGGGKLGRIGSRKWESVEVGSRNAEFGKKEGEKGWNAEVGISGSGKSEMNKGGKVGENRAKNKIPLRSLRLCGEY